MGFNKILLGCFVCVLCFSCASEDKSSEGDINANKNANTSKIDSPELNAYFQTKLDNVLSGVEENQTRLDGLESRIEEVKGKIKLKSHEILISNFEDEWADIFNENNEINTIALEAESIKDEDLLNQTQNLLKSVNSQIDSLDLALFKVEPSIRKGKEVKIETISPVPSETVVVEKVKQKEERSPPSENKPPPDYMASTSKKIEVEPRKTTTKPTVEPKIEPKIEPKVEPSPSPESDYDSSMGDIVIEDCKRLKRKLDKVSQNGKKLTTGSNSEYANVFSQSKKEMDIAIADAQNSITQVEKLVAAANSEKNIEKVFLAKQKTSKINKEISDAEKNVENLARKVDGENTKKAAANKAAADKAAADKAAADKAAAEKTIADKAAANKAAADKAAADKAAADKAAADKDAADKAAAEKTASTMGAAEHPAEVKNAIATETIQKLMKLSPNNRDRTMTQSIEGKFADPNKQSITVIDEYQNSKVYSVKDYARKMIISGPYFIEVDKVVLNSDKKIIKIVLKDTKVQ